MKPVQFDINVAPFTEFKVRVIICPRRSQVDAEWFKRCKTRDNDMLAFCSTNVNLNHDVIATVVFNMADLSTDLLAHELFHASLVLGRRYRVICACTTGEEVLAEAIQHMLKTVLRECRKRKIRVRS